MADRAVIICVPTSTEGDHVVEGSRKEFCELCAEEVWLAPSSFGWREQGAMIACTPCGLGLAATEPDPQLVRPTREQYAELREHYRKRDR